ncbi:restriction endonuclease subunit S [Staphylococcus aureus]|nr:restriction endonuclease subunit S [Staphylococcus aureus]
MSNKQKKNVPELRFPGFEGEWEEKKLGEVGTFTSGGTPLKSKSEYWNGDIPWITTGDIHNIKRENIINFITEKGLNESSAKLITNEAILIAMYGQGKTRGMSAILNFEATTNQACAIYQTNQNINFVFQYFQKLYEFLRSLSNEGSQKNLSLSLLKEITLNYPNEQEQKKIGDFFSKLDRQIELEEQKLELLQQQKKGYMQKIFSQELRFKDENGNDYPEWEETTIKEIAQINTGKKDTKDAITNGSYDFYVRSPIVYKINTFSYEGEAILTVGDGVGVGKVFHYVNGKFDYHQRVYKISDFKNYYGLLLFYYFSQNFLKETKKYSAKTSVDSVRKDMIANMKVPRPIYIEQKKIGQFIKRVDNKTKIQKQVIELLKQRKKALLQKMFI